MRKHIFVMISEDHTSYSKDFSPDLFDIAQPVSTAEDEA
jgi:hypothetical protein